MFCQFASCETIRHIRHIRQSQALRLETQDSREKKATVFVTSFLPFMSRSLGFGLKPTSGTWGFTFSQNLETEHVSYFAHVFNASSIELRIRQSFFAFEC